MFAAVVLVSLLVWAWAFLTTWKRRSMPPGEWGWPVVGHLPPSDELMEVAIGKLRKKHGDIFTWKIGTQIFVILCDFQMIKKVFNDPDAQDRPDVYSVMIFSKMQRLGLFNVNGEMWKVGRRFSIRHLRDQGMGRTSIESSIALEVQSLVESFSKHTDVATEVPRSLSTAILNIIWKITADKRYDLEDPKIQEFQNMVLQIFHDFQGNVTIFDVFPFLIPITPNFIMEKLGVTGYIHRVSVFLDHMKECIEEHKKTLDPDNPRDYIDAFLIEMLQERHINSSIFTEDNLIVSLGDIFSAATETTSISLRWFILYMVKYKEIQQKIQEEIDSVVPRDRLPGLDDRTSLNLTQAALYEMERLVSVTPLLAPHCVSQDMEINGYQVPKGAILLGHAGGCHTNPKYWARPDDFYPQHFLDEHGKFRSMKEGFLPFSIGRRVCPGENLARQTMFLFGSALLHTFTFEAPEGAVLSTERNPLERLIAIPFPFKVIMRKRK